MTTRRTLLGTAAGLTAVTGAGLTWEKLTSSDGAATWVPNGIAQSAGGAGRSTGHVPAFAERRDHTGTALRVPQVSQPLSHLAIGWGASAQTPRLRMLTSRGWGSWEPLHTCRRGRDEFGVNMVWALASAPDVIGYDIESRSGVTALSAVELNTLNAPPSSPTRGGPAGTGTGPLNTAAATAGVNALTIGGYSANVRYLNRAAWAANESWRFKTGGVELWPTVFNPIQALTVHHTTTMNADPNPAATVRALYHYDAITQGWGDLGYHLLIDEAGRVYEGRWSGADPTPMMGTAVGSDGRPQVVDGAHVHSYNSGNIGIAMLGDFTSRLPTVAARGALVSVLAMLAAAARLTALATVRYVHPVSGLKATVDSIAGHRAWAPTQCPGNLFAPYLGTIRRGVGTILAHPQRTLP